MRLAAAQAVPEGHAPPFPRPSLPLVSLADLEGLEQTHGDLHAAALPIGDKVHAPGGVDVEHVNQLGPARGVHAGQAVEHLGGGDVALHGAGTGAGISCPRGLRSRLPASVHAVRRGPRERTASGML